MAVVNLLGANYLEIEPEQMQIVFSSTIPLWNQQLYLKKELNQVKD